jgi:glutathione S-transferase
MLKLYFERGTCSLASLIALLEAGLEFELIEVKFENNEQLSESYLKINPKARVPTLVTGEGYLTETPAILTYIAQQAQGSHLALPEKPFELAQINSFNSYLCSTVHVAHAHRMRGYRWADDPSSMADMQRKAPQAIGECFDLIERHMFRGPWVHGERYTISDPYLFTLARWMKSDGVDPQRFPKILVHFETMNARSAVASAMERDV